MALTRAALRSGPAPSDAMGNDMPRLPDVRRAARDVRSHVLRMGREERGRRALWPDGAPGAVGSEACDHPTYSVYVPRDVKPTGDIIVVLPGGGYAGHAEHEASPVGRRLAAAGVCAVVVRYRLAPRYRHPAMLDDARQAIAVARARAPEWGLVRNRVGVLGFSAGGHLAGMAALFEGHESGGGHGRPDFAVLIYPVVQMTGECALAGVRGALLGNLDETPLSADMSLDRCVGDGAPPCFIVHGNDDAVVDVRHSLRLAGAYRSAGRPFELHVFAHGPHGFGLGRRGSPVGLWPDLCLAWLRAVPDSPRA